MSLWQCRRKSPPPKPVDQGGVRQPRGRAAAKKNTLRICMESAHWITERAKPPGRVAKRARHVPLTGTEHKAVPTSSMNLKVLPANVFVQHYHVHWLSYCHGCYLGEVLHQIMGPVPIFLITEGIPYFPLLTLVRVLNADCGGVCGD